MAASRLALLLLVLAVAAARHALPAAGSDAHPGYDGAEDTCGVPAAAAAAAGRMEEYGVGRILDITHAYRADLPAFAPGAVTGPVVRLRDSMANGTLYNLSELKMECHMGTHVDAPGHMNQGHFAAGLDVDKLDLDLLNGPTLLVDTPRNTNITAKAMESLNIPKGVRRVLFRTLNTDRYASFMDIYACRLYSHLFP
ncbi:hypothetical protein EE612_009365 [Oryza sativa]|nr:hypothetical protein EE612_009365 [Oryza sativa]